MSLFCKVCNERINLRKKQSFFDPRYNKTRYCSFRCQIASLRNVFIIIGNTLIVIYIGVGTSLFLTQGLWLLLVVMIPFVLFGLILLIGGFASLGIYVSIKRRLSFRKYFCYYCNSDITETSKHGSLVCDSCGNKVLFCNLCSKIINPSEQIAVIKPCNHTFHKNELLDYAEENKTCPSCYGKVQEISFILEKKSEFW